MKQSIINMVWVGDAISPIEALCMKSFIQNGMHVKLNAYNLVGGVPQDVELCDANLIIPKKEVFKHMGSYAAFADLFRWKLMYNKGGYYVDTDVLCLQRFEFKEDVIVGWEHENTLITPTVLGFKKAGHELAKQMLYNAMHPLAIRPYDPFKIQKKKFLKRLLPWKVRAIGWGNSAGPIGLTNEYFLDETHYGITPLPQEVFYKISYPEGEQFVIPNGVSLDTLRQESYAAHLWNEMWRRNGIDKNKPFPKTSFIGQAMERYW